MKKPKFRYEIFFSPRLPEKNKYKTLKNTNKSTLGKSRTEDMPDIRIRRPWRELSVSILTPLVVSRNKWPRTNYYAQFGFPDF